MCSLRNTNPEGADWVVSSTHLKDIETLEPIMGESRGGVLRGTTSLAPSNAANAACPFHIKLGAVPVYAATCPDFRVESISRCLAMFGVDIDLSIVVRLLVVVVCWI